MKALLTILLALFCLLPAAADHLIEHGGHKIVTFDVPQVDYKATKEGKKYTRTFFSREVGNGNLKITVKTKGWLSELKAEQRYNDDRREKRRDQNARLNEEVEVPGALKTLTYHTTSPYKAQAVVVYTKDFRCEMLVTGTDDAEEQIMPTYEQLLKTLKVVPRTKIGELQIGD